MSVLEAICLGDWSHHQLKTSDITHEPETLWALKKWKMQHWNNSQLLKLTTIDIIEKNELLHWVSMVFFWQNYIKKCIKASAKVIICYNMRVALLWFVALLSSSNACTQSLKDHLYSTFEMDTWTDDLSVYLLHWFCPSFGMNPKSLILWAKQSNTSRSRGGFVHQ